ncbi:zf-HC2 domain-containing protein [Streptomyces sp. NPDC000594]|uniref:anti-sigma factor family protein n=1 Tax=Streptomyces sp. NPDC000594 TaxID=3154261 RepID=UPI0033193261
MTMPEQESVHDAVGAYVLGILDEADASAFEEHLAGCDVCALHLEEFSGMEPMLAMLAEAPLAESTPVPPSNVVGLPGALPGLSGPSGPPGQLPGQFPGPAPSVAGRERAVPREDAAPRSVPLVPGPPAPRVLDSLLDEVAAKRAARRRRGMYLVAAAAALVIGGPLTVLAATSGGGERDDHAGHSGSPARDAFFEDMEEKVTATDPATRVEATVGTEKKGWGTHAVLELKNVKGPLKCSLVAVSTSGEEEVVTSWAVPKWGYGIKDSTHKPSQDPLYVHGGAAMNRSDIDRFEVRTFDGQKLVEVDA